MNVALSATSEPAAADPLAAPVVIVGAGLAGLMVALHLADRHPVAGNVAHGTYVNGFYEFGVDG